MHIHDLYTSRLIPLGQLQEGLMRFMRSAFRMANGHFPATVFGGKLARTASYFTNEMSHSIQDTLGLVSAWLLSNKTLSRFQLTQLERALEELETVWQQTFKDTMRSCHITETKWPQVFTSSGAPVSHEHFRRATAPRKETLAENLASSMARHLAARAHVLQAIGYQDSSRSIWLKANVDPDHPLSSGGRPSSWRTLYVNSNLGALGTSLGASSVRVAAEWEKYHCFMSSRVGRSQRDGLLKLLAELPEPGEVVISTAVSSSTGLLPAGSLIERTMDGRIRLAVSDTLLEALPAQLGISKKTLRDYVLKELPVHEHSSFVEAQKSFVGTMLDAPALLEQAMSWQESRKGYAETLKQQYQSYLAAKKRRDLLTKLSTHFTDEEQKELRSLLTE